MSLVHSAAGSGPVNIKQYGEEYHTMLKQDGTGATARMIDEFYVVQKRNRDAQPKPFDGLQSAKNNGPYAIDFIVSERKEYGAVTTKRFKMTQTPLKDRTEFWPRKEKITERVLTVPIDKGPNINGTELAFRVILTEDMKVLLNTTQNYHDAIVGLLYFKATAQCQVAVTMYQEYAIKNALPYKSIGIIEKTFQTTSYLDNSTTKKNFQNTVALIGAKCLVVARKNKEEYFKGLKLKGSAKDDLVKRVAGFIDDLETHRIQLNHKIDFDSDAAQSAKTKPASKTTKTGKGIAGPVPKTPAAAAARKTITAKKTTTPKKTIATRKAAPAKKVTADKESTTAKKAATTKNDIAIKNDIAVKKGAAMKKSLPVEDTEGDDD